VVCGAQRAKKSVKNIKFVEVANRKKCR